MSCAAPPACTCIACPDVMGGGKACSGFPESPLFWWLRTPVAQDLGGGPLAVLALCFRCCWTPPPPCACLAHPPSGPLWLCFQLLCVCVCVCGSAPPFFAVLVGKLACRPGPFGVPLAYR